MMTRRSFAVAASAGIAATVSSVFGRPSHAAKPAQTFEVTRTEEEWRKLLTSAQFDVLRNHGTERAGTSPLDKVYAPGTYHCAGCDLPLFSSQSKFDSGTGWPSFYEPIKDEKGVSIGTSEDRGFFGVRTEIHCRRCGGHQGHVFEDGPKPTGLRYCINGVALKFVPQKAAS